MEQEFDQYVTTGRLIDQLVAAEAIVMREREIRKARDVGKQRAAGL